VVPRSVVEAGEPRDEEPTNHRKHSNPEGNPGAAGGKTTAATEVAASNLEISGTVGSAAGESSNWR